MKPECQVTMASTSMVHTDPVAWVTGPRQQSCAAAAPTPVSSTVSGLEGYGRQLDGRTLEEARSFIQRMDYSTTTWQDDDDDT